MAVEKYITPADLITESAGTSVDEVGNPVKVQTLRHVMVAVTNVSTNEYYQARAAGEKTIRSVKVRKFDYSGQEKIKIGGIVYDIYKTADPGDGSIICTCRDHVIGKAVR